MEEVQIQTEKADQVVDITEEIIKVLARQSGKDGLCNIFVAHTTCALTTADLDPGTDLDTLDFLRKLVPSVDFRHPHDPAHTPDHILSSIIGASITIPFKNKQLILGTWQRIVLIEFNGPQKRKIHTAVIKMI